LYLIYIFGHQKDFLWGPRGFQSSDEHDAFVIQKWNELISKEDTVYVLGDVCMGDLESGISKLKQLKGHKHLIRGNHDTDNKVIRFQEENIFETIQYATMIKYKKYQFYLSHYPTYMGNYDMQMSKIWCLHGHTHSKNTFCDIAKNYNVNLDAHNCCPIEIEVVLDEIHNQWNQIYQEKIHLTN